MNAYLRECIKSLRAPDDSEILRALSLLDSAGIFICPSEPLDEYIRRASRILDEIDSISCGNSQFGSIYSGASKAPGALISSAAEITWQLYRFRAEWIPTWESKKLAGAFLEGIQYEVDGFFPLIFLKNAAAENAAQILAHEMCHAAKTGFPTSAYDEWFPRNAESSAFRKIFGNFFRDWRIPATTSASILAGTIFAAAGKIMPWGICALAPAAAALAREVYLRRTLAAAKSRLQGAGFDPMPLLFRIDDNEIRCIARSNNPAIWIENAARASLRWKMYAEKFGPARAMIP